MEYEIQKDSYKIRISTLGACMRSLKKGEKEYLWQGDERYWTGRDLVLFPYIARLTEGRYRYQDKEYCMDIHGFAKDTRFQVLEHQDSRLVLGIKDTHQTRQVYPFAFEFKVVFEIENGIFSITYEVENLGENTMYFGIGGHPGFQVPIEEDMKFEQYFLKFSPGADPMRIEFSEDCFPTERKNKWELDAEKKMQLSHSLFDEDAIVLEDHGGWVKLYAQERDRSVTVTCPDMKYLGIWHWPGKPAPYICLEPWSSLPSRKGRIEDLEQQPDLLSLGCGCRYKSTWTIEIH